MAMLVRCIAILAVVSAFHQFVLLQQHRMLQSEIDIISQNLERMSYVLAELNQIVRITNE